MTKRSPLTADQREAALALMRKSVLFGELEPDRLDILLQHSRAAALEEGQLLFEQQQPANEIFLLESGQIKLARVSGDGHEKVIDLISPGNTFGEAIMFSKMHVFPVTARALVESRVLCIDSSAYAAILHQSTDACFAVMAQMSRRLHWQIAEIDRLTLHNAMFRVVTYLLDQVPSTDRGASEVMLSAPKHVIASRLSVTPETLSRTLSKLNRDGLIDIGDQTILLKDVGRLRRYVQGEPL